MQNKLNDGKAIQYTNPTSATITAGTPVFLGAGVAGVAVDDIPGNAVGVLDLQGTFDLPKATATTISAGQPVVVDAGLAVQLSTATITTVAGIAHKVVGTALDNAGADAKTVKVLLK